MPAAFISRGSLVWAPGFIVDRSSTVSPGPANWATISSARTDVSTSMRNKPARCSLVSE